MATQVDLPCPLTVIPITYSTRPAPLATLDGRPLSPAGAKDPEASPAFGPGQGTPNDTPRPRWVRDQRHFRDGRGLEIIE